MLRLQEITIGNFNFGNYGVLKLVYKRTLFKIIITTKKQNLF